LEGRCTLAADLRYAFRRLLSRPVYALLSIATLALGIGGTAAAYGVTRGVLFDPLPYAHASEVGVFWKKTDWTVTRQKAKGRRQKRQK
jgi:putative ABC transport system permease protein